MDPVQIELAWTLRAQGHTWPQIGEAVGESEHKVRRIINNVPPPRGAESPPLNTHGYRRWLEQNRPAPVPASGSAAASSEALSNASIDEDEEDAEVEAPEEVPHDLRPPRTMSRDQQKEWYSRIVEDSTEQHRRLLARGAGDEARKVLALAISASKELGRLNRDDGGDSIRINKEELAQRAASVRAKLTAYLETKRPLLCSHCGHALSVAWGKGDVPFSQHPESNS
jgi:hypothetical protein